MLGNMGGTAVQKMFGNLEGMSVQKMLVSKGMLYMHVVLHRMDIILNNVVATCYAINNTVTFF